MTQPVPAVLRVERTKTARIIHGRCSVELALPVIATLSTGEDALCHFPAWLAQHAVTRLLAEPHYHVPLPPPRNDPERAARAHDITTGLAEDCHLATRLLHRQQRPDLARKVLARAPDNADYRRLSSELGRA